MAALDGIRVLESATLLAGPFCAQLLGDLGAEVTKVEQPGGEPGRYFGSGAGSGAFFAAVNRGKRGVPLDLRESGDRDAFGALVADCDVLIENFLPTFRDAAGVTDAWLHARNPGLVHCSISGFGASGPDAERPATDLVLQALSGLMLANGREGDPPIKVGVPLGDMTTGLVATLGVLAALRERDADPNRRGRRVSASILESLLTIQGPTLALAAALGHEPPRLGSGNPFNAPVQVFATADAHVAVSAFTDKFWQRLAVTIDRPHLLDDPRFATNADRLAHRAALSDELDAVFATRPTAEWLRRLVAAQVPCAPIHAYADVFADEQVAALGVLRETIDDRGVALTTVGVPFSIDGQRPSATGSQLPRLPIHQSRRP